MSKNKTQNIEQIESTEELEQQMSLAAEDSDVGLTQLNANEKLALMEQTADQNLSEESSQSVDPVNSTELEEYAAIEVEEVEFIDKDQVVSIIESLLFSSDRPQSLATIKQIFKGTNIGTKDIKRVLEQLMVEYAGAQRGVALEEVTGGYQLRTKPDNMEYLKRLVRSRPFKLSGPALEVLSIVAYKQPCAKVHVDEIRGVESGHLLRSLMDKGIMAFAGKSELPGKPMLYQTTRKFLEIFGLRNLTELPTLLEIDELLPDGIEPEEIEKKQSLNVIADSLQADAIKNYSASAEELDKITDQLSEISTSSEFFEAEKRREKERRGLQKAQDIRELIEFGEKVSDKDRRWLEGYDQALLQAEQATEENSTERDVSSENSAAMTTEGSSSDEENQIKQNSPLNSDEITAGKNCIEAIEEIPADSFEPVEEKLQPKTES